MARKLEIVPLTDAERGELADITRTGLFNTFGRPKFHSAVENWIRPYEAKLNQILETHGFERESAEVEWAEDVPTVRARRKK